MHRKKDIASKDARAGPENAEGSGAPRSHTPPWAHSPRCMAPASPAAQVEDPLWPPFRLRLDMDDFTHSVCFRI